MNFANLVRKLELMVTKAVLIVIAILLKLIYKTLRIDIDKSTINTLEKSGSSAIFCWHGEFSMMPYVNTYFRHNQSLVGLVSNSKDGTYLSYFFSRFGVMTERGSSSRNGGKSAINLIRILRKGGSICITPDGPRGPNHKAKGGMLAICERSPHSRMVFVRITFGKSWKFKSWDSFKIPMPFSKVQIRTSSYGNFDSFKTDADLKETTYINLCEQLLG